MTTQTDAMKQALEQTLEMLADNREYIEANERAEYLAMYDKAIAGAEKALAEQPAQQNPSRYQELREVLEDLMSWQVKNVDKWHNGAYDQASKVLKRHDAAPQPPAQLLTDEKYEAIVEDLADWSRYVEVDTAHQSLEAHVRQVLADHGITKGNT